jgi:hypothetical protein
MDPSHIPLPLLSFSWVFFISSMRILQMANTRNCNNNSNVDNNGENNQNVNSPPPPLPTLEQVLVMQAQMLLRTHYRVNRGARLMWRKVTLPTNDPVSATALLRQSCPPLRLPVGLSMFLLDRSMFIEGTITSQWRRPSKLQAWSLVHFLSMTLLQLCCLILEHRILSYPLHLLRSIICP